jgi:DNA-directed RNA polymerase specialized sigma24 family protein
VEHRVRAFDGGVLAGRVATDPTPGRREDGSERRFADWIAPYWDAMAALAGRMSAAGQLEDVLQEALAAAWAHQDQFDPRLGSPRNWLLAIVANQARRSWRHEPAAFPVSTGSGADSPSGVAAGPTVGDAAWIDLQRAIHGLSDRQRIAVELYYFIGLAVADVAEVMSCAPGTVKSTLADARRHLRSTLGEDYR